jgi:glucose/arabinose dehydrogenase
MWTGRVISPRLCWRSNASFIELKDFQSSGLLTESHDRTSCPASSHICEMICNSCPGLHVIYVEFVTIVGGIHLVDLAFSIRRLSGASIACVSRLGSLMNFIAKYAGPTVLFASVAFLGFEAPKVAHAGQAPAAAPAAQPAAPGQAAPAPRGRPNPLKASADLYAAQCAGCHGGTDGTAGRAPYLFNEDLLKTLTDPQMTQIVRHGIPGTAMAAFAPDNITDPQLFELIFYIRSTAGSIKPKTQFVADPDGTVVSSEKQKFKIEVLSRGLETPWALAFLPDGRLLITERPGRLRIYDKGKLSEPVKNTPVPFVRQDGGYLDISVHPQYAKNGWIYMSYSEPVPGVPLPPPDAAPAPAPQEGGRPPAGPTVLSNTVIVRGKINKNNEWTDNQVLFRSPVELYSPRGEHYGSRFAWDKQGHLFFTLGERGDMKNAQDLTNKNSLGKVHRINDDGSVPKDNPFVNKAGADPTIWSYGHRNPEGLAFNPVTGKLWESEHGPVGGDEINVIEPGHNYGWGVISMGIQPGITERSHEGMEQPIVYYTPTIAPTGISFYTGNKYPGWKDSSLFVSALLGQQLRRLEVSGNTVTHQEILFAQFGRVRDIVQGPDGLFYVILQNPTGVNGISLSASTPGLLVRLDPVP